MYDIVYILKHDVEPGELAYSLRSVAANFPHGYVWFFGGKPKGVTPNYYVPVVQRGATRYDRVTYTLREICNTPEVSPQFWLFNDDFFIMRKLRGLPPMYGGEIADRVRRVIAKRRGMVSEYARQLTRTRDVLEERGYTTLDYALHVPMLIDKAKAVETLAEFDGYPMFRCLYGNHHAVGGIKAKDVKVAGKYDEPDKEAALLSTNALSWAGVAGEYIRERFPTKSLWEV